MLDNNWTEPDACIESNSCLTGGGALTHKKYFHFEFPRWVRQMCDSINQLECIVLVLALKKFAADFLRGRLVLNCDNFATVSAINSGVSRNEVVQRCLRFMHKIMAWESVDVRVKFLCGRDNRAADSLSRWTRGERFRRQFWNVTAHQQLEQIQVVDTDFDFLL